MKTILRNLQNYRYQHDTPPRILRLAEKDRGAALEHQESSKPRLLRGQDLSISGIPHQGNILHAGERVSMWDNSNKYTSCILCVADVVTCEQAQSQVQTRDKGPWKGSHVSLGAAFCLHGLCKRNSLFLSVLTEMSEFWF